MAKQIMQFDTPAEGPILDLINLGKLIKAKRTAMKMKWAVCASRCYFGFNKPDLKGTDSLGCNVLTKDHDIAAVFYAGGCYDDFSNQRHVLTD